MFADEKCNAHVERCRASLASLNLEDGAAKTILNRLLNALQTMNCSEDTEDRVLAKAKEMLTSEQYEKFERELDRSRYQMNH